MIADIATMYASFDHVNPPIGADGTPYQHYCAMIAAAQASGQQVGWSNNHGGFWLVTGYPECVDVMRSPHLFSNAEPTLPRYATNEAIMIAGQDDPDHKFARALVNRPFNPAGVMIYSDVVRDNLHLLIDGIIEDGRADLAQVIAKPVPAMVTALLMGVPAEEGPKFSHWISCVSEGQDVTDENASADIAEMYRYFEATIERHRTNPGEDILSRVIHANVDGRTFTQAELLGFCVTLMIGGIDNSYRLISAILWRLSWDGALRRRLIDEPDLIPGAIEEALRYYSPAFTVRQVIQDSEFHGARMRGGDIVLIGNPLANRDPRVFPDPDCFIVDRKPNNHLGLGQGIHRCLGAHLIALEAKIVVKEFLDRIPDFALDETIGAQWIGGQVAGMEHVPVKFPPGHPRTNAQGGQVGGVQAWLENVRAQ